MFAQPTCSPKDPRPSPLRHLERPPPLSAMAEPLTLKHRRPQVDKLTGEAVAEKAEIRKLIDSGIGDVTSKILVLKHVAMGGP